MRLVDHLLRLANQQAQQDIVAQLVEPQRRIQTLLLNRLIELRQVESELSAIEAELAASARRQELGWGSF